MSGWTDERIAELTRRWEAGETAAAIATALGDVSRNGVIGKAARLGLSKRASPIRSHPSNKTTERAPRPPAKRSPAPRPKPAAAAYSMFRACQWIEGQPTEDDSCKCGAPTVPGRPYCARHNRRSISRVAAR